MLMDGLKLLHSCLFIWSIIMVAQISLLPAMCFYHNIFFNFLLIQSVILVGIVVLSFLVKEKLLFSQVTVVDSSSAVEKKRFALATLRHDIRSPLSGILLTSRLLYQKTDHPELKHLQYLVVDAAKRALETVDSMDDE